MAHDAGAAGSAHSYRLSRGLSATGLALGGAAWDGNVAHAECPIRAAMLTRSPSSQPRQVTDIKTFLEIARRKDASAARIKRTVLKPSPHSSTTSRTAGKKTSSGSVTQTKFKIRCSKYLYTLVVEDSEKAEKLKNSLPPGESRPELRVSRVT